MHFSLKIASFCLLRGSEVNCRSSVNTDGAASQGFFLAYVEVSGQSGEMTWAPEEVQSMGPQLLHSRQSMRRLPVFREHTQNIFINAIILAFSPAMSATWLTGPSSARVGAAS